MDAESCDVSEQQHPVAGHLSLEYLLERVTQNDVVDAVQTNRLNAINGSIERAANATEDLTARTTQLEVKVAEFMAETKGEHKSTRKEVRLIGLAVAGATILAKFIPTPTQHVAHAAFALIGLG